MGLDKNDFAHIVAHRMRAKPNIAQSAGKICHANDTGPVEVQSRVLWVNMLPSAPAPSSGVDRNLAAKLQLTVREIRSIILKITCRATCRGSNTAVSITDIEHALEVQPVAWAAATENRNRIRGLKSIV